VSVAEISRPTPGAPSAEDAPGGGRAADRAPDERRSTHPVDRLGRELGSVCTTAVDPLEIAAVLESQGFTDAAARDFYECEDIFELARQLWERTPTVVVADAPALVLEGPGTARDLLHGVIFALNGVFFTVGLRAADDPRAVTALVVSLVIGWAAGQSGALLWFRVVPRAGDEAGRTVLRRVLLLGLVAGLVFGSISDRLGLPPSVTLMGVGQVYLVVAASALLLYRRELWFFLSLVPATTAVFASIWAPDWVNPERVLAVVVFSIIAILAEAAMLVRPRGRGPHHSGVEREDATLAVQMGLYGVMAAVLLSHTAMSTLVTEVRHDGRGWDLTVLPLVLTIGVAEWQLRSYRQLSRQVLGLTADVSRFGIITWRFLLGALTRYMGVLAVATAVLWLAVYLPNREVPAETTLLAAAYVVLGGALFLNLVIIAHGRVELAVRAMVAAATLYGVVLAVQTSTRAEAQVLASMYLAVCAGLLFSLLAATRSVVRQTLLH
jgi:hypothetical protein